MNTMKTMKIARSLKIATLAPVTLVGLSMAQHAWADDLVPPPLTKLVEGSAFKSDKLSFGAAGTVTVSLKDLDAFSPLTALSFTAANTSSQVLASFTASNVSGDFSFNVAPGTYYANIMATAGGPMGLGLYSMTMNFTPSAVPLPSSGWLLLTGALAILGLARAVRPPDRMGTAEA